MSHVTCTCMYQKLIRSLYNNSTCTVHCMVDYGHVIIL